MISFFDLVQKDDFRRFVEARIATHTDEAYCFPASLPKLYKYRSLSSHAIDDIINGKIMMTSIGDFNDVFDGAIHQYGSKEEIEKAAIRKWDEMETHRVAARIPAGFLKRDDIVIPYMEYFKTESRLKFRVLDFLGTYVCCFSKDNTSTLMWAHYADSNKGICIEYEFDKLPPGNLLRDSIFPVAYTEIPINLRDLLEDKQNKVYTYPIDAAVLCSALNKAKIWEYEQEWRIIFVLASSSENTQRLSINSVIHPSSIYLGYHFLKPFFYYDYKNTAEYEKCSKRIEKFIKLISHLQDYSIPVYIMTPVISSYRFKPYTIPADALLGFMFQFFDENRPEDIKYYYTLHDHLMDIIEKEQETTHA